jgi:hypothetical protein
MLIYTKILAHDSIKPIKLQRHLEAACAEFDGKTPEIFQRKLMTKTSNK